MNKILILVICLATIVGLGSLPVSSHPDQDTYGVKHTVSLDEVDFQNTSSGTFWSNIPSTYDSYPDYILTITVDHYYHHYESDYRFWMDNVGVHYTKSGKYLDPPHSWNLDDGSSFLHAESSPSKANSNPHSSVTHHHCYPFEKVVTTAHLSETDELTKTGKIAGTVLDTLIGEIPGVSSVKTAYDVGNDVANTLTGKKDLDVKTLGIGRKTLKEGKNKIPIKVPSGNWKGQKIANLYIDFEKSRFPKNDENCEQVITKNVQKMIEEKDLQNLKSVPRYLRGILYGKTTNIQIGSNNTRQNILGVKFGEENQNTTKIGGYKNPSIVVNTDEKTAKEIINSNNPRQAIRHHINQGNISYRGIGPGNTATLGVVKITHSIGRSIHTAVDTIRQYTSI